MHIAPFIRLLVLDLDSYIERVYVSLKELMVKNDNLIQWHVFDTCICELNKYAYFVADFENHPFPKLAKFENKLFTKPSFKSKA